MSTLTHNARQEKERKIRQLLDEGKSLSEIGRIMGTTSQSVHKFLNVRGWKTKVMLERNGDVAPEIDAAKEARKAARRAMPKDIVDRSGSVGQK